jgi:hypothetical protein
MAAVAAKLLTADEFFDLPEPADGSKLESARGEVVAVPSPGVETVRFRRKRHSSSRRSSSRIGSAG